MLHFSTVVLSLNVLFLQCEAAPAAGTAWKGFVWMCRSRPLEASSAFYCYSQWKEKPVKPSPGQIIKKLGSCFCKKKRLFAFSNLRVFKFDECSLCSPRPQLEVIIRNSSILMVQEHCCYLILSEIKKFLIQSRHFDFQRCNLKIIFRNLLCVAARFCSFVSYP